MIQKVLFLVPPNITFNQFISPDMNMRQVIKKDEHAYGNLMTDMPIGLISMSAYVKMNSRYKHEFLLRDFNLEINALKYFDYPSYYDFFLSYLKETQTDFNPNIIGISSLFAPSLGGLLDLAKAARNIFPDALIISGGSVPSSMYNYILGACDYFDALCYGEGEIPLLELLDSDDKSQYINHSHSWITKQKEINHVQYQHTFVNELDDIPFLDYDLCDPKEYGVNPAMTAYANIKEKQKNAFHVMTSRGCPFKCTFCASHKVHGRKMRYHSIERVKSDFERLKQKYSAGTLIFQDDHLMGDKKRAYDIICMIKDIGLTAVFQNGLALYALDRKMLVAIKEAGVKQLVLAAESGSANVLKNIMKKPLKLRIVEQVAKDCRDLGIYTSVNILVGMPGETKQDIEDSRQFLKGIDANWFIILAASPLVGSEMFDICQDKGYLIDGYLGLDYRTAVVETPEFKAGYIQNIMYGMNIDLNFVNNADMKKGEYKLALQSFENAIRAKNDHAIAYHYAALCCWQLGNEDQYREYKNRSELYAKDSFWKALIDKFHIPIGEKTRLMKGNPPEK